MDLRNKVMSGFQPLRKKRAVAGEPTTSILAKRVALGHGFSSEKTATEENVQNPSTILPELSSLTRGTNIARTSTPSRMREKEVTNSEQRRKSSIRTLGEDNLLLPSIRDALRMAWDLSWEKILGKLAQVSITQAVHGGFVSLCRTAISEVKTGHRSEIEATQVAAVKEKKDKILKLKRRLVSDGYNLCLKKMAKAYPEVNNKLLDQIEVSANKSREYEDNGEPIDSSIP
ncbi:hypothetical protein F0562_006002 [Nyssa sinensis]|uniref:Uncharacterized protein n=1 Tax=Nyssa sinensis TaxID=561372 RepID=A0A5J5AJT5_9ASTE|nr:hypothetical protein F0562_006002 [Nyssa sinensis]